MSTLTFADTHNMVAFLEKHAKSDGFYEIIDFLNANQIHYALTVNPTTYTSCIEQFWSTAKAKTVNGEHQLQALVDKKKVIITKTSIKSDFHLEDAGGIDCLQTATIFKELARMGAKTTAWNEFSNTMASAIICLATNQKFNLSKYIFDVMSRRKQKMTTAVPHPSDSTADVPNEKSVSTHSNDPLLSGEDRLKFTDLMDMCTKFFERVLDLEHTKTTQAQEIITLKLRVKKEDASNQGRSIENIDNDAEFSLVDETHGRSDDAEMFNTDVLFGNEVFAENDMIEKVQDVIPKEVSTAAPSTTAVTATTAPSIIPKAKGITFRDAGESTTKTPTLVSSLSIKDKGKTKMDEPEVPLKKKDQIALDEEMARNLEAQIQVELIEEERIARKKYKYNQLKSKSYDEIQKLFDNEMKRVNTFIPMDSEVMKSKEGTEESSKRTEDELESDKSKKAESSEKKAEGSRKKSIGKKRKGKEQKQESSNRQRMEDDKETDEHEEAEEDDESKMKKHMDVI
ncbi:hypothetical protein Tco_0326748 [Tanacetum coccineum]